MAKANKAEKPWLMASALLGLPKVLRIMQREELTLSEAENLLRLEAENTLWHIQKDLRKEVNGAWAPADFRGLILYSLSYRERWRAQKRGGQIENQFRDLRSWLLDVGAKRVEKLRIALGQNSDREDAWRIRAQIEEDSKGVLEALRILGEKLPCDSARWNGKPFKGERAKLLISAVRLSLEVSRHRDTLNTLRKELETWQDKQREAEAEVRAYSKALADEESSWRKKAGAGKTGKQRRG